MILICIFLLCNFCLMSWSLLQCFILIYVVSLPNVSASYPKRLDSPSLPLLEYQISQIDILCELQKRVAKNRDFKVFLYSFMLFQPEKPKVLAEMFPSQQCTLVRYQQHGLEVTEETYWTCNVGVYNSNILGAIILAVLLTINMHPLHVLLKS